ncbi:hypothetical protein NKG94_02700 [Micromonospora sp. M12]
MTTDLRTIRSWFGRAPRRVVAAAAAGLAVVFAAIAAIGWGVASARDQMIGEAVSGDQMAAIVAAARSCPVLTPARLAGQLMAESELAPRARTPPPAVRASPASTARTGSSGSRGRTRNARTAPRTSSRWPTRSATTAANCGSPKFPVTRGACPWPPSTPDWSR